MPALIAPMPPAAARHGHALDLRTAFALRVMRHAHRRRRYPPLAVRRKRRQQLLPEPLSPNVPPPPVPAPPAAPQPPPPEPVIAWALSYPRAWALCGRRRSPPQPPPSDARHVELARPERADGLERQVLHHRVLRGLRGVGMATTAPAPTPKAPRPPARTPGDVAACCTSSAPYTLYASRGAMAEAEHRLLHRRRRRLHRRRPRLRRRRRRRRRRRAHHITHATASAKTPTTPPPPMTFCTTSPSAPPTMSYDDATKTASVLWTLQ